MNKETVYIGKDFCQYREMIYSESWKRIREDHNEFSKKETGYSNHTGLVCPICNDDLTVGLPTYMVMNNNKLFPNCVIHKSCAIIGLDGLEKTTIKIRSKYENFKKMLEEYKAWL